ncbi:PilZ domain-containing protein [Rossellomorea sp. NS-SX7]|uniref:PilZ domain-containing protein n=1 Tax=Rossellomorea sp. NS-SX7 TaxID=3463856 RepID=UPI0040597F97
MQYKRHESFRYTFNEPINATYRLIIEKNGELVETKQSDALLIDLSPNGARMKTALDLPIEHHTYLLDLHFTLNQSVITMLGKPVWKRKDIGQYMYGIEALEDEKTKQVIIKELKQYVSEHKDDKRQ